MFIDGDNLIELIKSEAEKCPASVQSEMNGRLFAVRNEWNAFKKTARRPAQGYLLFSAGRVENGAGGSFSGPMTRSAVLNQGIDALQNTGASLQRAEMVARESEEIGANVLDELSGQRETLLRARGRIDDTNADLKRSHRVIRMINMHVATNKCLLILIIVMEIIILLAIIYMRFIRK